MQKRDHTKATLRVILSGGGTGGHIFPAISIARELMKLVPDADLLFVGATGKMEMEKVPQAGFRITGLPVSAFHRKLTLKNLLFPFRLVASMIKAVGIINSFKPHLVIGTGGFASGPILRAAAAGGVPTLLQEQNSYPGVTNRLLARKVNRICVAWPGLEKWFNEGKMVLTGNPVRDDLQDLEQKKEEAVRFFGLAANRPVILIFGGSQGARTLNMVLSANLPLFAGEKVGILWQTGPNYYDHAVRLAGAAGCQNIKVFAFIREMNLAYAAADLVVCRAGAITLSELAIAAKPSLLVPFPHAAEDHQTKNALAIVSNDGARMLHDHEVAGKLVDTMLEMISSNELLSLLAVNISRFARPAAAREIALEALKLVPSFKQNATGRPQLAAIKRIYFLGIGGIGMSSLARHFISLGKEVSGYDRTPTPLTRILEREGMKIHYEDDPDQIPPAFTNLHRIPENLVIFTPALPSDHKEKNHLSGLGYRIWKRAEVLGLFSTEWKCLAIAGSHGKSSVSAMLTQICLASGQGCNAFLGAISKTLSSNHHSDPLSSYSVMEADEFDRSFLHLRPYQALVTSMDEDHLDIYRDAADIADTFSSFVNLVASGSAIILKYGLRITPDPAHNYLCRSYSLEDPASDYHAVNIRLTDSGYRFDLHTPVGLHKDFETRIPGRTNVENAVAALSMAIEAGFDLAAGREGIRQFEGLQRRFDIRFNRGGKLYMDDYAHHPNEIRAMLASVRELAPGKRILGIFQPHLFTRTRDFADDFAGALSLLDELILLEIYPAREMPIAGVDAGLIGNRISNIPVNRIDMRELPEALSSYHWDVLLTIGAGDIDQLAEPITRYLEKHVE